MSDIPRYKLVGYDGGVEAAHGGGLIFYTDHEAALTTAHAEIERLKRERDEWRVQFENTAQVRDTLCRDLDRVKADRDAVYKLKLINESAISAAIGSVRFMDPPDGGDVSLAEQVSRMRDTLTAAESTVERLREALTAAVRAANLAMFVINKQGVMPNSSWESGFKADIAKAEAALDAARGTSRDTGDSGI